MFGEHGMRKYSPWTTLFYGFFVGAVIWNLLIFPFEAFLHAYSPLKWGIIFYIGILGSVAPFAFYFKGIDLIRATRASAAAMLEPIIAGVISYFLVNEVIKIPQIAGGLLVIGSILALILKKDYDDKIPGIIRAGERKN